MTPVALLSTLVSAAAGIAIAAGMASAQAAPQAAPAAAAAAAAAPAGAAKPVSWTEFSGYKRYPANCSVCHGPDGLGGTFAPALTESLKAIDHDKFLETVVNGKENAQLAMPAFGADPNVMCYIEDIYVYLKARSDNKVSRGRPDPQPAKPKEFAEAETACMGA